MPTPSISGQALEEEIEHLGIELGASAGLRCISVDGLIERNRLPIHAIAPQRVEHIRHRRDPSLQRDLLAEKARSDTRCPSNRS